MEKSLVDIIAGSEYFDKDYYIKTYPVPEQTDPAEHYLRCGWKLCYDPSERFSTAGYLYSNHDVLKAGENPLLHYERAGKREKRRSLTTLELVRSTKIFDPYFYAEKYFGVNAERSEDDAILDYLTGGWENNLSVNPEYDLTDYIDSLPQEEKNCVPVLHYMVFGCKADRKLLERRNSDDIAAIAASAYFDEEYYRETYKIGKVTSAARHYLEYGAKQFYDPSAAFSTSGYYYKNRDVFEKNANPLLHYEKKGKDEHRQWLSTRSVILSSGVFDAKFYCAKYLFDCIDEKKFEQWAVNDFIANGVKNVRLPYKDFKAAENRSVWSSFIGLILDPDSAEKERLPLEKEIEIVRKSSKFNRAWYNERYGLPPETDGAEHYCTVGYKLNCDPSLDFCTEEYLGLYSDELGDDANPMVHYELYGKSKKYQTISHVHQTIRSSDLFDEEWYVENFMREDTYRNPIVHYIKEGASKGYPASECFSSARYLICNRDVADLGMNPLFHYIIYGKGKRDAAVLFKRDLNIRAYERSVQDYRIHNEYDCETEALIVFLLPTSDSIGGGVMSINSIAKVTDELTGTLEEINGYKVLLATYPSSYTFSEYTKFECAYGIYRFDMLREYFTSVKKMILHIPENFVADSISQMSPEDIAWLHNIGELKINILNQNNDMMPRPYFANFLHAFTDDLTITCAHRKYCTPNQRSSYNMPVHMLSTSNLVEYKYRPYDEKENLLLYSPDANDTKPAILEAIREAFPELKMKMIKNIEYSEYLELISRAKWMITFGEGLDGYAMESIRSGAVSFAVFNHTFFNERFEGLPNIYNSYQDMLTRIVDDMKTLDEPQAFKDLNDLLIKKDREEKDETRYRNNIRNYYLENYTYPMTEVLEQRQKRMEEKPLVSIVMATYNGEKFLQKQLESIEKLTYDNFELIISDDGSTDDTLSIIESFKDRLNISLYTNEGKHGATGNFENGLNHINGEYVALCDQDDIWLPDHIEKLLYQIDEFDIIHGRLLVIDENDRYHTVAVMHQSYEISKVKYTAIEDYLDVPRLLGCASLVRASAIKESLPFPEEAPYHDWWITVKCILDGNGICFTDELVTKYRQHGNNTALTEYQDGSRIGKHYQFMNYLEKAYADKLSTHQRDLISRIKNWCLLYPIFHNAAGAGMDAYFSKHRSDFSDEVIGQIVEAFKNKERNP